MPVKALETYNKKRNFKITAEPKGDRAPSRDRSAFVIQKHAASHLHYDFRLEAEGVLKSWAVPKGPSTDPSVKRLAMQTEDHPLDYASFEGVIPAGQYGGGNVIVWDHGTYRNTTMHHGKDISLSEGLKNGHVTFWLDGEKLKGGYSLIRTARPNARNAWLLVKMNDAQAHPDEDPVAEKTTSVLSGRNVEDLSADNSKIWISNRAARSSAPQAAMPAWIEPMLATLVEEPFDREGWMYEPKLDGERCLAYRQGNDVQLYTRNHKSLNITYPELVKNLKGQKATSFIIDGEIVAFQPGTSNASFKELQKRMHLKDPRDVKRSDVEIFYYIFDILALNGRDLRSLPLRERKTILEQALRFDSFVRLTPHQDKDAKPYYHSVCRQGGEGLIAKRADSRYISGRSRDWLKFKCVSAQEFVIGGYSKPQGTRDVLGALLIGYYENNTLKFAGKVGTGFDQTMLALLGKKLSPLKTTRCPFRAIDIPTRDVQWVDPQLVCEVIFSEWTDEGKLRHPRFIGLRDDKKAQDVLREKKVPLQETPAVTPAPTKSKAPSGKTSGELEIDHKKVALSHLDKVFYPSIGFTKGQVLDYYIQIAPIMLPYLKGRPITMKRYPNGVAESFFYEKQAPSYRPSWLDTYAMKDPKTGKVTEYAVIQDMASLVWMANLACLEFHVLLARAPKVDQPTMLVFDLDPGPNQTILDCIETATQMRKLLDAVKLKAFPKTSGSKGLHLYIPLNTPTTYERTTPFAHAIAQLLEKQHPNQVVSNMRKNLREGKIFVDWSQNSRHKTTVAPYSLRALPAPSVSTPVTWDELDHAAAKKDPDALRFSPRASVGSDRKARRPF